MSVDKVARRLKIKRRIRGKIFGLPTKPRLSVYRSNEYIYAQLIDDLSSVTLAAASSQKLDSKVTKIEESKLVGKAIAELALAKGITDIVFDRGGYLYHGRVKALAEGAREAGLKF
jgi:large subunit ribosomal protein L18